MGSAANSYEILAKLAMGGMAEIFLARGASAAGVERYVVLKRVLRHRASDQAFVRMFLDEARLAAQLQHPNIAQVYDIGKLGDSYFFTMEYVHGETVRTLLQRSHALRRPIPISATLTLMAGAAAGLHHAHERKGMDGRALGIVHRDVSPSNLMISYEGTVKVVDFGVAKAAHRDTETRSGTVKGKITYMSPEQCKGLDIDRRSDLFSLGIVMWEMLTTERLFRRNSDFENMQAIVTEQVSPPSALRPEIPPEIDRIVLKLLSKRAEDRYQTADEVHEDIENAAVRTGSALSAASLGRFMRELFGQRPEPWIELQSNETHPEAFTVTSEPIANPLIETLDDELAKKLAAVPQLTQRLNAQGETPSHIPGDRPLIPTVPLRVTAEEIERPSQLPTVAMRVDPDLALTKRRAPTGPQPEPARVREPSQPPFDPQPSEPFQVVPAPFSSPSSQGIPGLVTQASLPSHPAQLARPSHPALAMAPAAPLHPSPPSGVPALGSMRSHSPSATPMSSPQYPVMSSQQARAYGGTMSQPSLQPKRSRMLIILIPGAMVGVIIGVVLAFGGKETKKPPEVANTVALTPARDEPAPIAPPPPAPTAAPTVPTVDTAPSAAPEAPAAPGQKRDVAALFEARDWAEVVAQCNASREVLKQNATACTLAACKHKEFSKAKRWFASVGSASRASVIKDCGGVLKPPSEAPGAAPPMDEKEKCRRNPMLCRN